MKTMKNMALVLALVAVSGCAYTGHEVSLDYGSAGQYHEVARKGVAVLLTVRDDRDSAVVGERGAIGAKIDANAIFPSFEAAVREMFVAKGYRLVQSATDAQTKITVRLRAVSSD